MTTSLSNSVRYRAVRERNRKFDGVFYFAKTTGTYCRPSCPAPHPLQAEYTFFDTASEAISCGYQTCGRCCLDTSKGDLSLVILDSIDAGVINDRGVNGFADTLHMSERQLRRIIRRVTGSSPLHFNQEKRIDAAKQLITCTKLPITDIAFSVGFSSIRQFNIVFKDVFNITPREMRKNNSVHILEKNSDDPTSSIKSSI